MAPAGQAPTGAGLGVGDGVGDGAGAGVGLGDGAGPGVGVGVGTGVGAGAGAGPGVGAGGGTGLALIKRMESTGPVASAPGKRSTIVCRPFTKVIALDCTLKTLAPPVAAVTKDPKSVPLLEPSLTSIRCFELPLLTASLISMRLAPVVPKSKSLYWTKSPPSAQPKSAPLNLQTPLDELKLLAAMD